MNYQKLILVGNASTAATRRTSKKGDVSYTSFNVGVGGGKDRTTFFPVVVFGNPGKAVAKYVTKGRQVLVEGRIEVNQRGYFNVVADRVDFGAKATEAKVTKKAPKTQ